MNHLFAPTIRGIALCLILLSAISFSATQLQAQCFVNVIPLQDAEIVGIPKVDSLVLCGVPDTLAIAIVTDGTVTYPSGMNLTFELPAGMQYAGEAWVPLGSGMVSEIDVSDVENPRFLVEPQAMFAVTIINLLVEANCELVPPEDSPVSVVLDFVASQMVGGQPQLFPCTAEFRPLPTDYSAAFRIPVVNIIGGGPTVNGECVLTFTDFSTEFCDTLIISQDGIQAYVDSFILTVDGLDLANLNLTRIEINDMPFNTSDPAIYQYDAGTQYARLQIGENFFPGNFDPNGLPTQNDLDFNVNEQLTAVFCFTANDCASVAGQIMTFGATYGCYDRLCFTPSEKEVVLNFTPSFSPEPIIQANVVQSGGICGDNFIAEFEISSDLGGMEGLYQDFRVLIPLCGDMLELDGTVPMLDGLEVAQVNVYNHDSGTFVPVSEEVTGSTAPDQVWLLFGSSLNIDFNNPTVDVDGASGGIADIDGDGNFDDLPGDQFFRFRVEYAFVCSDQATRYESSTCGALACSIEGAEVRGLRSCGQAFQQTTAIQPGPLNYYYGATDVSSNAGPTASLTFGYQYGGVGAGSPPVPFMSDGASVSQTITHGYQFTEENITGCANAQTYLEVVISGASDLTTDAEFVSGSAGYDDNGTFIPVPDTDVTTQLFVPTPGDTVFILQIDLGSLPNPTAGIGEFTYDLAFNTCVCHTRSASAVSRIIETCPDCPMECSVVKSCLDYDLFINSEICTGCVCPVLSEVSEMYRISTGYSDKTMTNKLAPLAVDASDQRRLLPGDTMFVRTKYTVADAAWFNRYTSHIQFRLYHIPISESILSHVDDDDTDMRQLPSIPNSERSSIRAVWIQRAGSTVMQPLYLPNTMDFLCYFTVSSLDPFPLGAFGTTVVQGSGTNKTFGDFFDQAQFFVEFANFDARACLDDFYANNAVQDGDMIFVDYWIAMQPNPGQDRSLPEVQPAFSAEFIGVSQNPALEIGFSQCLAGIPYDFHNPGPVEIDTDIDLPMDGCTVDVTHTFTLADNVPIGWYANEYRPISGLAWLDLTIPPNLAYCGPMNIIDYQNNIIGQVPASQLSFPNMTHIPFGGTDYYIANAGETLGEIRIEDAEFTNGAPIVSQLGHANHISMIDPVDWANGDNTLVGGTFPLIGVGNQAASCNFRLEYQLKRICQENVLANEFTSILGSSYTTTEDYLSPGFGFYETAEHPGQMGAVGDGDEPAEWLGLGPAADSDGLLLETVPGGTNLDYYWPYTATQFNNFGEGNFLPGHFYDPHGVGVDNNGDGEPDNIYGVGYNPHNQLDTLLLPNFTDNSGNFPSLTVSIDFSLLADDINGFDINYYEVCAGTDGAADLTNVVSTITLPNTISLEDVRANDETGPPLVFTMISTDPMTGDITYQITHAAPGDVLSPGECYRMAIITELLFCPLDFQDLDTQIAMTSNASCLPAALTAQLSSAVQGACLSASTVYEYISEEADLQVEFFIPEGGLDNLDLCEEFCIAARIKNVKTSPLIGIFSNFFFPNGLEIVPGSWEVAYPGGPVNYGNGIPADQVDLNDCMDTAAWTSIPDPMAIPRPRGTSYVYDWATDLFGAGGGVLDDVISNGLPGVSTTTAVNDSNKVSFRFRVRTLCDEYTSNSVIRFIAQALDPCGNDILSNLGISDPIIVDNIRPEDYAQLLTIPAPTEINCGEMGNLVLTVFNISTPDGMGGPATNGSMQCITIPTDGITYMPGSFQFLLPAGFDGMPVETDVLGADGVTVIAVEVCFSIPDGIAPGQSYQIDFDYSLSQAIECNQDELSVAITTDVMNVPCVTTGEMCSVNAPGSVNPTIPIHFLPPLDLENFKVVSACDNDPTMIVYSYMFDLTNPGPDFMNTLEIDVIRDLNQNGILDAFETDPGINPPLIPTLMIPVDLPMGTTTSLMGEVNVPEATGCPVFLRIRQNSACACDENIVYIDETIPEFFADLGSDVVLCPGSPLVIDLCPDLEPSAGNDYLFSNGDGTVTVNFMGSTVMVVESDPIDGIDFSLMGDDLVATLNPGFGVDGPVDIDLTVSQGLCQSMASVNVRAAPDLQIDPVNQMVCSGEKSQLDLNLDAILEANATFTWSPTTFLDDPTSPKPLICNPTSDIQYTVNVVLNDSEMGCSGMTTYDVQVLDPGMIDLMYQGEVVCYDIMNPGVLVATSGFTTYNFIVLVGGMEFVVQSGPSNTYNVPGPGGTYFVRADDGSVCGLRSDPITVPGLNCGECPDIYNGQGPLSVCSGQTLDSIKVFTGSTSIDGIAFVLFNSQQINPDDVYNYSSTGGIVLGSTTPMIMPPDTMATIYDVSVPTMPMDYYIYAILNPTPPQASCRPLEEIVLTVHPLPMAGMTMDEACEDENGLASFVLSDYDDMIDIDGGNTVTYHLTEMNAEDDINAIISDPYMTSVDITIYVRVENAQGCYSIGELILQANQLPMTAVNLGDMVYCDGDPVPPLCVQNPGTGFTVEWYVDAVSNTAVSGVSVGGFNNECITLSASSIPALPMPGNSVTVYAQVRDDATGCVSATRTPLTLTNNPRPMASPAAMTVCEDEFQSRIGTFDLSLIIDDINADFMEGATAIGGSFTSMSGMMMLTFHTNMSDATMDINQIPAPTSFMNTSLGSQTLFVRVENDLGCFTIVQVQLSVAGLPDTDNLSLSVCPDIGANNMSSGIDLTALEGTLASGNTPGSYTVTWFENSTLTTPVTMPTNVTVMNGSDYYAVITFNAAPMCSNVAVVNYTVDPSPPVMDITLEFCEDEPLMGEVANINLRDNDLTVASGMAAIVNWFEDINLTFPVPDPTNITLNMSGNGTEANIFYAQVSDGNCENRARVEYIIFQQPVPEAGGPYEVCAESNVTLSGATLSGSATVGEWMVVGMPLGGDGVVTPMGLLPTPSIAVFTATVPGIYILQLTTDDPAGPCVANTDEVTVTVHPLPVVMPEMGETCAGEILMIDGMPTQGTAPYITHQWIDLGGGTASGYTLNNTDMQVLSIDATGVSNAMAGTIELQYTVTDSEGCMDSGTTTVIIHPLPVPNPMDGMLCVGDVLMVDGMPTQGTAPYITHQWTDLGGGTASNYMLLGTDMQTVTIDASMTMDSEAGTVNLQYTVTDVNNCMQSATITVTINPLPEITPMGGNITCTPPQEVEISASTNAASPMYMWSGPGIISGIMSPNPTVNLPGVYTVTVTDGVTDCMNTAQVFVTQDPLSKCLPATFEVRVKGGE